MQKNIPFTHLMHHSFYFTTLFHRSCIHHRPTTTFVLERYCSCHCLCSCHGLAAAAAAPIAAASKTPLPPLNDERCLSCWGGSCCVSFPATLTPETQTAQVNEAKPRQPLLVLLRCRCFCLAATAAAPAAPAARCRYHQSAAAAAVGAAPTCQVCLHKAELVIV